jgi:Carboxypeptidase regulatory-like domain
LKSLSAIFAVMAFSTSLFAQTSGGRLVVTVTDQSDTTIKAATLTIINERTNEGRKVTTNAEGVYAAPQLEPSNYTVRASQAGFADSEAKGLTIQVGQELRTTLVLAVSSTSAVVNVQGRSLANVDTSSAKVGVNVSEREVAQLPLNGRQLSQLYLLTPGAVNGGGGSFDNIRFSGRSNQQNIIRFDGVESSSIIDAPPGNLNGETTSNFRLQQSLENIQEFRVDSSNYPAEYGTGTGGQISVITKSGSNDLHGSLFDIYATTFSMPATFSPADQPTSCASISSAGRSAAASFATSFSSLAATKPCASVLPARLLRRRSAQRLAPARCRASSLSWAPFR